MNSRERVERCLNRKKPDRLPIRHLATDEIDEVLLNYFGTHDNNEVLNEIGCDFRDIRPELTEHCGYSIDNRKLIISCVVWNMAVSNAMSGKLPLADVTDISNIPADAFIKPDVFDYSILPDECAKYEEHIRIFGYSEFDFINGISALRGNEQVLIDIATLERVYLDLIYKRFEFTMEHIELALKTCKGKIDIVSFGDDFGSQRGLLISPQSYKTIFEPLYREGFALAHKYGAKTMLHCCGSNRDLIGDFIDTGLDILDVIQTDAARMDLEGLKEEFGNDIIFAGSMSVQKLIPFGTREQVRTEARKRAMMFNDGGLIYGPSHVLQPDSVLDNILEMYGSILGRDISISHVE